MSKARALLVVLLCAISTLCASQTNSCETATPFVDNSCVQFFPPIASIQSCYTFTAPTDSIEFTFTAFVPQGTCQDALTAYSLYDQSCLSVAESPSGLFTDLQPGGQYVVCYTTQCPTTGVVTLLCTAENIVLPVRLIYITASSTATGINVTWATGSELNCYGFMVERSTDLSSWINIGFVEGMGNSMQLVIYNFEDRSPVNGVNYYRLTQYDTDGDYEVLQVIAIMWNAEYVINPFRFFNLLGQSVR